MSLSPTRAHLVPIELTCVKYLVNQVEAQRLSAEGGMRPQLVKFTNLNHVPLAMIWIDDGSDFEVSPDSLSVQC